MNRASSNTGWVRNPVMIEPDMNPKLASCYELGYTWNPITGCLNHTDGICKGGNFPCYAYQIANGRCKQTYLRQQIFPIGIMDDEFYKVKPIENPFYPRLWPNRLSDPFSKSKGKFDRSESIKGIFVCDMSDLFGIGIPNDWTLKVLGAIKMLPQHRFYLLTKQPQNLIQFSPFPDNCWVGVTATDDKYFDIAVECLRNIEAKVKFLSIEPLLKDVIASPSDFIGVVDWVIIGAQTKPNRYPEIEWVRATVQACDKAGVPVFLKDNLKPLLCTTINNQDIIESHNLWAFKYFKLRQELPV